MTNTVACPEKSRIFRKEAMERCGGFLFIVSEPYITNPQRANSVFSGESTLIYASEDQ
jgi:hypothetical protein